MGKFCVKLKYVCWCGVCVKHICDLACAYVNVGVRMWTLGLEARR